MSNVASDTEPGHTIIVSDMHLSDAQPLDPQRPLWKRFKGRDLFIDGSFARFLDHVREITDGPVELIFNGDVFDFDSVMKIPEAPDFAVRWLERRRGLDPEEAKSAFKMSEILSDHATFVSALRQFLLDGNRVVFIVGNHDIELHWPAVQAELRRALDLPEDQQDLVRVCEWFYISGTDTLVEHGNQYDRYCVCQNPVHPLVSVRGRDRVRLPFGNVAGKYMLNGMGLFNPHVESSFIRPLREYIVFFWRYMLRTQPLLVWSWFWTAMVTLIVVLREGLQPALRDPFSLEDRVNDIAQRSNSTPSLVRSLKTLQVHSAVYNPISIARELWLDRALLLAALFVGTFQVASFLHIFVGASLWWWVTSFAVLLPPFIFYARTVSSNVNEFARGMRRCFMSAARLAGVGRMVVGHTHRENHTTFDGVEVVNTGTWSPAYEDVECTIPLGRKCFAWLKPVSSPDGEQRHIELRQWQDPGSQVLPWREPPPEPKSLVSRIPGMGSEIRKN